MKCDVECDIVTQLESNQELILSINGLEVYELLSLRVFCSYNGIVKCRWRFNLCNNQNKKFK